MVIAFDIISICHYFRFDIMAHSSFLTFAIISVRQYLPFEIISHSPFINFELFPFVIIYHSTCSTIRRFFSRPFIQLIFPIDVFFTVGVIYYDVLLVNQLFQLITEMMIPLLCYIPLELS
jgi:hypothetical protein